MLLLAILILVLAVGGGVTLQFLRVRSVVAFAVAFVFYSSLLAELGSLLFFRAHTGQWVFEFQDNPSTRLFRPHPYLTARGIPNVSESVEGKNIRHNELGFRGPSIAAKSSRTRIGLIGGSTTYGAGVSEGETWAELLQLKLGPEFEVLNFGIPGQSTVENLHFVTFQLPAFEPDIIIFHVGLNDMHVEHASNLEQDYANVHVPLYRRGMGFCYVDALPRFASIRALNLLFQKLELAPTCEEVATGLKSKEIDKRTLEFYQENISSLLYAAQRLTKRLLLVPQIIIPNVQTGADTSWWSPYIDQASMSEHMRVFNAVTKDAAEVMMAEYLDSVDNYAWAPSDFADPAHLNRDGNEKLAELISRQLKRGLP